MERSCLPGRAPSRSWLLGGGDYALPFEPPKSGPSSPNCYIALFEFIYRVLYCVLNLRFGIDGAQFKKMCAYPSSNRAFIESLHQTIMNGRRPLTSFEAERMAQWPTLGFILCPCRRDCTEPNPLHTFFSQRRDTPFGVKLRRVEIAKFCSNLSISHHTPNCFEAEVDRILKGWARLIPGQTAVQVLRQIPRNVIATEFVHYELRRPRSQPRRSPRLTLTFAFALVPVHVRTRTNVQAHNVIRDVDFTCELAGVRVRELAAPRRRFGYRSLRLLPTREGHLMNHKLFRRLYREAKLQMRRRGRRKWVLGGRAPIEMPAGLNERRSLDFLSDCFIDGPRLPHPDDRG